MLSVPDVGDVDALAIAIVPGHANELAIEGISRRAILSLVKRQDDLISRIREDVTDIESVHGLCL